MFLTQLRQQLLSSKQRVLLHLQGDRSWAYQWLKAELDQQAEADVLWFGESDHHSEQTSSVKYLEARLKQYKKYLGQEKELVIIDVYAGFNPDAFGALAGIVKLGGICVLITPDNAQWANYPDPELTRFCTEPYQIKDIQQYYTARLIQQLDSLDGVVKVSEDQQRSPHFFPRSTKDLTVEQKSITSQLTSLLQGTGKSSLASVIQADRGRGKSSLLGLVGANILKNSDYEHSQIIVTAPLSASVQTLFFHCQKAVESFGIECVVSSNSITTEHGCIQFVAPDKLMLEQPDADFLFVDEAAAIPIQMLKPIINKYQRAVFATTVHGYEGTGRGFEYKLKPLIAKHYQQLTEFTLAQPIRWYSDDFLEANVNRLLALDVNLPVCDNQNISGVSFNTWSSAQLQNDEQKLMQIFSLLVNAHYRTSPADLRQILDGPNISVVTLEMGADTVAAALIGLEGALPDELTEQIWQGRRRPRGHLFPQSLIAHSGFKSAGKYSYHRIIRIATHPALQRQGLGRQLLEEIEAWSKSKNIDFICTSYGYAEDLYRFWLTAGMETARVGLKQEASTGEYSVLMLKPLTPINVDFYKQILARFKQMWSIEIDFKLRDMDIEIPVEQVVEQLDVQDMADLQAFSEHFRSLNTCLLAMCRFVYTTSEMPNITIPPLILDKSSAQYTDKQLIDKYDFTGEKQLIAKLRELWRVLLQHAAVEVDPQSSSKQP